MISEPTHPTSLPDSLESDVLSPVPRPAFPVILGGLGEHLDYSDADALPELNNHTSSDIGDRNASPSRASSRSASSNLTSSTIPQLKRKLGHKHMRQQLHSARDLSLSSTDAPAITRTSINISSTTGPTVSASAPPKPTQVFLSRSNTNPSPKRPPASHSSYGVETTAGPPPSFNTRQTLPQERAWRVERSKSLRMTLAGDRVEIPQSQPQIPAQQGSSLLQGGEADPLRQPDPATPVLAQSSPETAETQSINTPTDGEDVAVMDVRSEQGLGVSHSEVESKASSESHKSEDLFLNIARVDAAGRPSSSKGERRRSRPSLPFLAGVRPASSHQAQAIQNADSSSGTPRADVPTYHSKRSSLQFGQLRGFDASSEQESTDASHSGNYSKRSSTLYAETLRPAQRSSTIYRGNRLVSESGYMDRNKFGEQNATESTASTTAPSTVWDELDDLKSRIRKLELTGKLPPSSAAAMSSTERPRTATTAATTMSSSPKHNKMATQLQSTLEGVSPSMHPLLHEALGNAKSVVSHDVYQKLQATAQDALQLASLTSYDGNSVRAGVSPSTDRQIRRRTESMCRSLTELAIALASETKMPPTSYRPPSRDYALSPAGSTQARRYSQPNEPAERPPVTSRVQSRLENRRVSTQFSARHTSPEVDSPTTILSQYPGSGGRVSRIAGGLRTRRAQGFVDGVSDQEEPSPSIRPVSRAMTDVAAARRTLRDPAAVSREYTSQHPLPVDKDMASTTRTPLPSNLSTNFVSRRKNISPGAPPPVADSSPLAARKPWGRMSIANQDDAPPPLSDTASEAPVSNRSVSTRRSFGFASRIGSSVGNRLRSARTDRVESRSYRDAPLPADPASIQP